MEEEDQISLLKNSKNLIIKKALQKRSPEFMFNYGDSHTDKHTDQSTRYSDKYSEKYDDSKSAGYTVTGRSKYKYEDHSDNW